MRVLKWLLILLVLAVVVPPLYYLLVPAPRDALPAPGTRVPVSPAVSVNVLDGGTQGAAGKTFVLVHGLPGSAYDWRELQADLVARGHRVIAYDRVGYGHSDPRRDDAFSADANTAELLALLNAMQLNDVTVVGWSYGGVVAMLAAQRGHPRLARIALVASAGPSSASDQRQPPSTAMQLLYSTPVLRWRSMVPPISQGLMSVLSEQAFSGGEQPAWWMPNLRANFSRWDTVLTYRGEMFYPVQQGTPLQPETISLPTLIVHAEDDRLTPVAVGRYLASTIAGAAYVEIPKASHMLPVTHAATLADALETAWTPVSVPAAEPAAPVSDPAAPAAEPAVPASEPAVPAAEPAVPASEPAVPASEPAASTNSQADAP